MRYDQMTKDELLQVAKDFEIVGRHDFSKSDLLQAVLEAADDDGEEELPEIDVDFASKDQLVELKKRRRRPSPRPRGEDGKVIRKGRNLSGNVPYARKFYGLPEALLDEANWPTEYRQAVEAAPGQVRLILKFMREHGITEESPEQGGTIVGTAVNKRYFSSKIDPPVLFAYYRRVLEALGVVHVEDYEG